MPHLSETEIKQWILNQEPHKRVGAGRLFEYFGNEFGAAEENEKPDEPFDKEEKETGNSQFF